jgi:hypothetical protein
LGRILVEKVGLGLGLCLSKVYEFSCGVWLRICGWVNENRVLVNYVFGWMKVVFEWWFVIDFVEELD